MGAFYTLAAVKGEKTAGYLYWKKKKTACKLEKTKKIAEWTENSNAKYIRGTKIERQSMETKKWRQAENIKGSNGEQRIKEK